MEELIAQMNPHWESPSEPIGIPREKYLSQLQAKNKDIILLSGLRRVGKSTLLKQHIHTLITQQVNPKTIFYLSLDMLAFNDKSIQDLVTACRTINRLRSDEFVHLFLDEVTAKALFRQELKNLYDMGRCKIFATASSASLLKDKMAYLTGRVRTVEVEPLDFDEFLLFRGLKPKVSDRHLLKGYFEEYMEYGGMPEYVLTKDPAYITNLVDNIIYKDIITLNGIRETQTVRDLFRLLCERVGKPLSYNKLGRVLDVSNDTVKKFVGFFLDTYLFFMVEKDARSLNERIADGKKFYCADVGIKNVTTGFRDKGAIFENLVYLSIRKHEPRYVKIDGIELDFTFGDTLIEAKYGGPLQGRQKALFDASAKEKKTIASDVSFFTGSKRLEQ